MSTTVGRHSLSLLATLVAYVTSAITRLARELSGDHISAHQAQLCRPGANNFPATT